MGKAVYLIFCSCRLLCAARLVLVASFSSGSSGCMPSDVNKTNIEPIAWGTVHHWSLGSWFSSDAISIGDLALAQIRCRSLPDTIDLAETCSTCTDMLWDFCQYCGTPLPPWLNCACASSHHLTNGYLDATSHIQGARCSQYMLWGSPLSTLPSTYKGLWHVCKCGRAMMSFWI